MEYKDYYKILGLEKNASADAIKKTFRKLAMKYHPDRTKGDKNAEEKFKEINEAYEVLSDLEKRKRYDEVGSSWQQYQQYGGEQGFDWSRFSDMGRQTGRTYTFDGDFRDLFGEGGYSDFFEMLFGQRSRPGRKGSRSKRNIQVKGADYKAEIEISLEEAYKGTQRIFRHNNQSIKLKIKPGIEDGHILKLEGKGESARNAEMPGDLLITIKIKDDPVFKRKGNDLYADLNIDLFNALLGGKVQFKSFKGICKIDIPSGTQNGKLLRLQKMGMPVYAKSGEYGDLFLKINIELPEKLTDKEKNLFRQLQELRVNN